MTSPFGIVHKTFSPEMVSRAIAQGSRSHESSRLILSGGPIYFGNRMAPLSTRLSAKGRPQEAARAFKVEEAKKTRLKKGLASFALGTMKLIKTPETSAALVGGAGGGAVIGRRRKERSPVTRPVSNNRQVVRGY